MWKKILRGPFQFCNKSSFSFFGSVSLISAVTSNVEWRKWEKETKNGAKKIASVKGQRQAQVTQLSLWKNIEGSCGFEPPKVLLEHRLFNRREKQCYSCFLHWWVFPTSKYNRDWVITLWSGIRWIVFLSVSSSLLLLCSFPCGQIDSSVKEISVISVVSAHSLAPSVMLALKHTLCVSGHGGFSVSLLSSPSQSHLSPMPFVPSHCWECVLRVLFSVVNTREHTINFHKSMCCFVSMGIVWV